MSRSHAPTVLVVDYDVTRLGRTRALLEGQGHPVVVARDSAMAVAAADGSLGIAVVADELQLAPMRRLVGTLRERIPAIQIVLVASPRSGSLSQETLERLGVHSYVHDADGSDRLLVAIDAALRAHTQVAQAQASDRLKMELLASVSHEFRTPLNVILGYLELVRDGAYGACPEGVRAALDKVQWNAGYLLELVEDFLDLAKLESGTVRCERLDVGALVRALVLDHELLVGTRPIVLRAEVEPRLPGIVAEVAKVRVVLQNLLANALKFTEQGEIVVRVDAPGDGFVHVRVRDSGPGLAPEAKEVIFDLFRQLAPGDMKRKGVGLGLALARRFARAMGGDVGVESTVGVGSTFTLLLPAPADADASVPGVSFAPRTV